MCAAASRACRKTVPGTWGFRNPPSQACELNGRTGYAAGAAVKAQVCAAASQGDTMADSDSRSPEQETTKQRGMRSPP